MDAVTVSEDKIIHTRSLARAIQPGKILVNWWVYVSLSSMSVTARCRFVDLFFLALVANINQPNLYSTGCTYNHIALSLIQTGEPISLSITFQSGTRMDEVQLTTLPISFAITIRILANTRICCS